MKLLIFILMAYTITGCDDEYGISETGGGYGVSSDSSGYKINDPTNIIDVFILAGQSNMMANTKVEDVTDTSYLNELTRGYIWDKNSSSMDLITAGTNTTYNRPTGYYANYFGPETAFMKDLTSSLNKSLYAVKLAWGSTSLEQVAGSEDWSEKSTDELLDEWKGLINDANAYMLTQGKYMRIRGIFWTQGEADQSYSSSYYTNLINFFADIRTFCVAINTTNGTTGESIINIITTLKSSQYGGSAAINTIIQAQTNYITNYGGVLVSTEGYTLKVGDTAHFDADSIIQMGQDAAAAVALIY